jgi:prepilin-type processing-associated H-X9-DG protein
MGKLDSPGGGCKKDTVGGKKSDEPGHPVVSPGDAQVVADTGVLLVVIAIIGTLTGLLLPAVQKVRETASRMSCQNDLKQMGLALHNYHDANRNFPPGYRASAPYRDGATDTTPGWSWGAFILPYLEQDNLYRQLNFEQPVQNSPAIRTVVKVYLCPSDLTPQGAFPVPDGFGNTVCSAAPTSYAACVGGDESGTTDPTGRGVFYRNSRTRMTDITDGTSNTILVGERAWSNANGTWAGAISGGVIRRGRYNPCQPVIPGAWFPAAALVQAHAHLNNALVDPDGSAGMDDFGSRHPGGSNFVFADGSVHFLRSVPSDNPDGSHTPDDLIFQALGTRAGGEVIPGDWGY